MRGEVKQIKIQNRTYYFNDDLINLKSFELNLLKINKKHYKNINIYCIGYIIIKKFSNCENIRSANLQCLIIGKKDGHIEEKNGNKYLVFDSTDENNFGMG